MARTRVFTSGDERPEIVCTARGFVETDIRPLEDEDERTGALPRKTGGEILDP